MAISSATCLHSYTKKASWIRSDLCTIKSWNFLQEPLVQRYPRMKTFLLDISEVGSIFRFSSRFVEKNCVQIIYMGEKMIENAWYQNE